MYCVIVILQSYVYKICTISKSIDVSVKWPHREYVHTYHLIITLFLDT